MFLDYCVSWFIDLCLCSWNWTHCINFCIEVPKPYNAVSCRRTDPSKSLYNFSIQTEQWDWTTGDFYFDFLQGTGSFLLHISRLALKPNQFTIHWWKRALLPGLRLLRHEVDQCWGQTCHASVAQCFIKHRAESLLRHIGGHFIGVLGTMICRHLHSLV
jgi:hypothetical protein